MTREQFLAGFVSAFTRWGDAVVPYYTATVRDRETHELLAILDVYDLADVEHFGNRWSASATNLYAGLTQHFGDREEDDGVIGLMRYVTARFPSKYCVIKAEIA